MSHSPLPRNPFTVGLPVPPERFIGRTSEIATAFDQIYNRSHLAIWGGSGMGRSSLLEKLASPQTWEDHGLDPSQAVIILFSCESITPFTPSGFWEKILSLLQENLNNESNLQAEIEALLSEGRTTKDSLRQVLRQLGRRDKFLVLLVDDYDAALFPNEQYTEADMEQFLSECRNLAYHVRERQYFSMIVTSLKRLNELGPKLNLTKSPWYNHYLFQSLKPFGNNDIAQLLGLPQTPELRDAIQAIAGGHPALLQIAGFLLYTELRTGTGSTPQVEVFVENFERKTQQIFQHMWARCSEVEQILLMLIVLSNLRGRLHPRRRFDLGGIDLIFTQRQQELRNLEEQGIIFYTTEAENRIYFLASSVMEQWVIHEIWNLDASWLQERQRVFLNLMSHKQTEKLTKAIRWLGTHRNEIPSTLNLLRSTVEALFNIFGRL